MQNIYADNIDENMYYSMQLSTPKASYYLVNKV